MEGAGKALLRKPNSLRETHTETQKRTGTHTPTERHANTHGSPSLHPAALFPLLNPALAQPSQVRHKHRKLAFRLVPRAARLRPSTAQLPLQSSSVALHNPLAGPQFPRLSDEETPQAHFTRLLERICSPLRRSQQSPRAPRGPLCSGAPYPMQTSAPGQCPLAQSWLSCSQSQGNTALGPGACRAPPLQPLLVRAPHPHSRLL